MSESQTGHSVELDQLTKTFGAHTAVDAISLSVEPGEFLTLLGPSGCGKTTTLRMIAGLTLPSSGQIRIEGVEMGRQPPYRRPVNTVFQQYALFPHLDVRGNVEFGLRMHGVPGPERRTRAEEALALVHLEQSGSKQIHQLSGGEQQRVALARALVNRPAVLLLDEPLGALDLRLRRDMQLELRRLNRQVGITFIYVTHDQDEAMTMSDRIAVMHRGRILQEGHPLDLYKRPTSAFVAGFLGEMNLLNGTLVERDGERVAVEVAGLGRVMGAATGPLDDGSAFIAVRPERVMLAPTSAGNEDPAAGQAANRYRGHIVEAIFVGPTVAFVVQIGTEGSIRARVPLGSPEAEALRTGSEVHVWFGHEETLVVSS